MKTGGTRVSFTGNTLNDRIKIWGNYTTRREHVVEIWVMFLFLFKDSVAHTRDGSELLL